MKDSFNREISYLRISITDLCNLRCRYCMPEEGVCKMGHSDIMSLEEIVSIVRAASDLGIKKIRLTGGEPLARKGIVWLCQEIKKVPGIEELAMTTNGIMFPRFAQELKDAGLDRINFSLDSLDANRYQQITRGGSFADAMEGIGTAIQLGFKKVKINTVLLGGFNDDEIPAFVGLTKDYDIDLRFIELMPMPGTYMPEEAYIPNAVVLEKEPKLEFVANEGVSQIYQIPGYKGRIGLISPISCSFCASCNRIRLTADGYLKPCLHSKDEILIRGLTGDALRDKLAEVILSKPQEHPVLSAQNQSESQRDMHKIGG